MDQTRDRILNGYEFSAPKWFDFANVEAAEQDGTKADSWFDTAAVNGRARCWELARFGMRDYIGDHPITALKSPLEHVDVDGGNAQCAKENSQPNTKPIVPPLNLGVLKQACCGACMCCHTKNTHHPSPTTTGQSCRKTAQTTICTTTQSLVSQCSNRRYHMCVHFLSFHVHLYTIHTFYITQPRMTQPTHPHAQHLVPSQRCLMTHAAAETGQLHWRRSHSHHTTPLQRRHDQQGPLQCRHDQQGPPVPAVRPAVPVGLLLHDVHIVLIAKPKHQRNWNWNWCVVVGGVQWLL